MAFAVVLHPMNYWLMKSEPSVFSIDHLAKKPQQTTAWDGVRNYQVRNWLRDTIKKGDLAFFYHSSCDVPGIAGVMEVVKEGYPDPTQFDPEDHHYDPASRPDNHALVLRGREAQEEIQARHHDR